VFEYQFVVVNLDTVEHSLEDSNLSDQFSIIRHRLSTNITEYGLQTCRHVKQHTYSNMFDDIVFDVFDDIVFDDIVFDDCD